ncbi:MAG: hypothetical protein AAGI03_06375 [Pseudomonadota bacterium]
MSTPQEPPEHADRAAPDRPSLREPYADDVPVTFRHRQTKRKGVITLWVRGALVMAGIAAALIAILALGPGIEFHEYWLLVAAGFGILGLLLLWEMIAAALSRD